MEVVTKAGLTVIVSMDWQMKYHLHIAVHKDKPLQ